MASARITDAEYAEMQAEAILKKLKLQAELEWRNSLESMELAEVPISQEGEEDKTPGVEMRPEKDDEQLIIDVKHLLEGDAVTQKPASTTARPQSSSTGTTSRTTATTTANVTSADRSQAMNGDQNSTPRQDEKEVESSPTMSSSLMEEEKTEEELETQIDSVSEDVTDKKPLPEVQPEEEKESDKAVTVQQKIIGEDKEQEEEQKTSLSSTPSTSKESTMVNKMSTMINKLSSGGTAHPRNRLTPTTPKTQAPTTTTTPHSPSTSKSTTSKTHPPTTIRLRLLQILSIR